MTDPLELEKTRELAKAATPGPWEDAGEYDIRSAALNQGFLGRLVARTVDCRRKQDTVFIAHMHPERALAYVEEIQRLRRVNLELAGRRADDECCPACGACFENGSMKKIGAELTRTRALLEECEKAFKQAKIYSECHEELIMTLDDMLMKLRTAKEGAK